VPPVEYIILHEATTIYFDIFAGLQFTFIQPDQVRPPIPSVGDAVSQISKKTSFFFFFFFFLSGSTALVGPRLFSVS
jgi:hypothetical protein